MGKTNHTCRHKQKPTVVQIIYEAIIANTTTLGDGCNNRVDFIDEDGNWVEDLKNHSGMSGLHSKQVSSQEEPGCRPPRSMPPKRKKKSSNSKAVILL